MVSNPNIPQPPDEAKADAGALRDAASREASSAKAEAQKAGATLRDEASRLASDAKDKAFEGAESGKAYAASSLNDFTAAIKKASEELGARDQSMAANLVREAASGLEQVSGAIEGKSIKELTGSVAGFARRQPAAFLIGAALAGVAIGRFAKASGEHDERDYPGADERPDYGRPAPRSPGYGASSSGTSGFAGEERSAPVSGSAGTGTSATGSPAAFGSATPKPSSSVSGAPGRETPGETTTPGSTSTPGVARTAITPATSGFGVADKKGDSHER
ncbi:hypothetical protein [Aureimonas populi]|uniref:Nutrient deprivation-induced protein n=1 Tax=Aureimonas populi TaxID=1701758 RepID=A0ABW5CQK4_9HYPH|nr:hypothetical protein [Aureimonas populi]